MEQSKIISIDVDISLKETNVRTVDAVLFSRDVNAPKMRFNITKDGEEISDSTSVSLLLTASNYLGILKDGLNIKLNGTVTGGEVTFVLPNDILAYEGIVRADVYIYWANGSNDGTQPILFSVKRSALDSTASTMSVVYVDEFEVEKARVTKAADDVVSTATAEIKARSEELDDNISISLAEIKAQSDGVELTASTAKNQINADVLAVDNAKDTAIATINATPSKLDEPINAAQNAISQSVNNVSNAETGAIATINTDVLSVDSAKNIANDSFNQSIDDVQNASDSAVAEIESVKPNMIQQINDIETNINTLVGLQWTNAIQKKIQTAWAWSADGTDRFTTVYPNLNLLKNTKSLSYTSKGTASNNSSNTYQLDGVLADILNKQLTISYNYDITNSSGTWSGTIRPTYGLGGTNKAVSNTNLSGTNKETVTFKSISQSSYGIVTSGLPAGTTVTITNLKVEFGSTATPWMPSSSAVTGIDYPKYRGIGVLSSTMPTDYFWEQSDTYIDYKWQQLKTAIIALGGTL